MHKLCSERREATELGRKNDEKAKEKSQYESGSNLVKCE